MTKKTSYMADIREKYGLIVARAASGDDRAQLVEELAEMHYKSYVNGKRAGAQPRKPKA